MNENLLKMNRKEIINYIVNAWRNPSGNKRNNHKKIIIIDGFETMVPDHLKDKELDDFLFARKRLAEFDRDVWQYAK